MSAGRTAWTHGLVLACAVGLAACGSVPLSTPTPPRPMEPSPTASTTPDGTVPAAATLVRGKSRWVAVSWDELPGFQEDALPEAWNAWIKSCERPGPVFAPFCQDVRRLSIGGEQAQRAWLLAQFQPYRVEPLNGGPAVGLLTAYFEPLYEARRVPGGRFTTPLYALPAGWTSGKPWFTRQEMETNPQAQAALRGKELVYLADPVQAVILQIQGTGRVRVTEPDGSQRMLRMAYAGTNGHPYQSIGRWLLDQKEVTNASWPGIRAWMQQNPQRVPELLARNPRVVFFQQEPLSDFDATFGPRGAQGVALTPGRSIAVDPESIPYGTPTWMASEGVDVSLQRLVMAQDTGSAIVGAVRADYFVGWGDEAGELAGRLKQPLKLWVLWPKRGH